MAKTANNDGEWKEGLGSVSPANKNKLTTPATTEEGPDSLLTLDRLNPIRRFEMSNTKAGRSIANHFDEFANGTLPGVDVGKGVDTVPVPVQVDIPDNVHLPEGFTLGLIARFYLDMASSFYSQIGTQSFTVKQLINKSRGKNTNDKVDQRTADQVFNLLKFLSTVGVTIDSSAHRDYNARGKHKASNIKSQYYDTLLPMRALKDGDTTYIQIKNDPPLHAYAHDSAQMLQINTEELDLTQVVVKDDSGNVKRIIHTDIKRMTPQIQAIWYYLMGEIGRIYGLNHGKPGATGYILYSSIYDALERGNESTFDRTKRGSKGRVDGNITKVCDVLIKQGRIRSAATEGHGHIRNYRLKITIG